jgi:hypothetical protein
MTAATLRQMAAAEAMVKSEIHMGDSSFLFLPVSVFCLLQAPNAAVCSWFLGIFVAEPVR